MINLIYVEDEIKNHPRTKEICSQFPKATLVSCSRYGEIFNLRAQNFRLQKRRPALILAKKHDHFVLPMPSYCSGIGSLHNYYFSHMLNCIYDCRYCFLQGMYQSAHYVIFVNYEDFQQAIAEKIALSHEPSYFFSGYDCDSLAFDRISRFSGSFLDFFSKHENAYIELRTKSVQVASLLKRQAISNCVVAFSFTPYEIVHLENKVPGASERLKAAVRLGGQGWKLGLRFDPLVYFKDYRRAYRRLFENIFSEINPRHLHSVSIGPIRFPKEIFDRIIRLYPDEKLFAAGLNNDHGMVSYGKGIEEEMSSFCIKELKKYVSNSVLFSFKRKQRSHDSKSC